MDSERDPRTSADVPDEPQDLNEVRAEEDDDATDPYQMRSMPPEPHGTDDDPASHVNP